MGFSTYPALILLSCIGILLLVRIRRLHDIPGPWLCSLTDLWRAYHQNRHNVADVLSDLHQRYGSVVKVGPNTVSVGKASAVPRIYTARGEFKKADSYGTLRFYINGRVNGTIIDIQDEGQHTALKRAFGTAFTIKNVQIYEHLADDAIEAISDRLREERTVEIYEIMKRFQIDFLLKAAFSEDNTYSSTDKDIKPFSAHERFVYWARWQAMYKIEWILFKTHFANKLRNLVATPKPPLLTVITSKYLDGRLSNEINSQTRTDLLQRWLDAQKKSSGAISTETVRRMVTATINAGFDTTAFTMTTALYHLVKSSKSMASLREELRCARTAGLLSNPPQWTEVNKLPYLDAVLKETMRVYPIFNFLLERVVPQGGAEICGLHLPGGTIVGCSAVVVGRDCEVYGKDVDVFRPERWITATPQQRVAMERGSLGFSAGKRICPGRHIAELEIKKLLPALVMNFEINLADPNAQLRSIDGITMLPAPLMMTFAEADK